MDRLLSKLEGIANSIREVVDVKKVHVEPNSAEACIYVALHWIEKAIRLKGSRVGPRDVVIDISFEVKDAESTSSQEGS